MKPAPLRTLEDGSPCWCPDRPDNLDAGHYASCLVRRMDTKREVPVVKDELDEAFMRGWEAGYRAFKQQPEGLLPAIRRRFGL